MKTAHDHEAFLDMPIPLDSYHSIMEQMDTFQDWLTAVTVCKLSWRDCGGLVRTVEHYLRLHVRNKDNLWSWNQPLIKASTYFPQAVFDQLRELPWLKLMRNHPDENEVFNNMQIAGGYVRIEFIRALRALCPGVVHWSLKIPDKAKDVDIWIKKPTPRTIAAMRHLVDPRQLDRPLPDSCNWAMQNTALDQTVDFVIMGHQYLRNGCLQNPRDDGYSGDETRAIKKCVIEGFDLSCTQFAFRRDNSGDVITTPLALYSLFTGKMFLCAISARALENQCLEIIDSNYCDPPWAQDRVIHRIAKYTFGQYGYTPQTGDATLHALVEKAFAKLVKLDISPRMGFYAEAGSNWDSFGPELGPGRELRWNDFSHDKLVDEIDFDD